jgi:hypothetical protein
MRTPEYLSPTSFSLFYKDITEFYLKYLADNRPPRFPQTEPMSVGSSFDAHVKSYLYDKLFGSKDPKFDLTTLFEAQVEEQNRDFALEAGRVCFDAYKEHGALADIMLELEQADTDPKFEFKVEGHVAHGDEVDGLAFYGYPDVFFHTKSGSAVIFDWKVNGFCSKGNVSPKKGYIMLRGPMDMRGVHCPHKDAQMMVVNGLTINIGHHMEQIDESWANQETIYAWILGEEVGAEFVVGIDQLAIGPNPDFKDHSTPPAIRIARHRCTVSKEHQFELFKKAAWVWKIIKSGWIFRDMTEDESRLRQSMLDQHHLAYEGEGQNEEWFRNSTRQHKNF